MRIKAWIPPVLLVAPIVFSGCLGPPKSADDTYRDQIRVRLEGTSIWNWTCIDFFNAFSGRYGDYQDTAEIADKDRIYKICAKKRGRDLVTFKPFGYLPADDRLDESSSTRTQPKDRQSKSQTTPSDSQATTSGSQQSQSGTSTQSQSDQSTYDQPPSELPPSELPPSDDEQGTIPESGGGSDPCAGGC